MQFDGPVQQPLRLSVRFNGGAPVTVETAPGTGRDPESVEHGVTSQHEVRLAGRARCGRNEVLLQGDSGGWTARSRIDVVSPVSAPAVGGRDVLGALALLAWAACAVLVMRRRRPQPSHIGADIALLVFGCAVGLALAEGVLRLAAPRLSR